MTTRKLLEEFETFEDDFRGGANFEEGEGRTCPRQESC